MCFTTVWRTEKLNWSQTLLADKLDRPTTIVMSSTPAARFSSLVLVAVLILVVVPQQAWSVCTNGEMRRPPCFDPLPLLSFFSLPFSS
jgi:hypothetical protein